VTRAPTLLLYADDNPDDRILVQAALTSVLPDVTLRCVQDGQALLDYLQQAGSASPGPGGTAFPDAILLDQSMPRKDGFATLIALKSDPALRHIPVIMVSTSARPEDVERAYDLGAAAFVRKPRSQEGLVQVLHSIQQFWNRRSSHTALRAASPNPGLREAS
jgi:CheY-like chemotaxis protein